MNLTLKDKEFKSRENPILPYGTLRELIFKIDGEAVDLSVVLTQALPEVRAILKMNFSTVTDRDLRRMTLSSYAQAVLDFLTECMGIFTAELTDMKKGRQLELPQYTEDFSTVSVTHTAKMCEMTEGLLEDITAIADLYQQYEKTKKASISIDDIKRVFEDIEDMLTDAFPTLDIYGLDNTNLIDILKVCISAFAYGSGLMARVPDTTPKNA